MSEDDLKPTYAVGRGKPPTHSRFKPGQSGNPNGRPRGSIDFQQALTNELNKKVTITENGRQIRLTKQEIAARQLANKGLSGDPRALELIAKHQGSRDSPGKVAPSPTDKAEVSFGSEEDAQVLEAFLQRCKQGGSS